MKQVLIAALIAFTTINSFGYYNPSQGRWLSRDPIEEQGFQQANISVSEAVEQKTIEESQNNQRIEMIKGSKYSFITNNPLNTTDFLGLSENCKKCGPDVTSWLVNMMNQNRNHPVIKTKREVAWPNWVPFLNLGWNYGFFTDFKNLVKPGGPWDFKKSVSFITTSCPSEDCKRTVTLCGICVDYDVPGNIHYGYVGRAGTIRRWFLLDRASAAQAGGVDPDHDVAAVTLGMDLWDSRDASLCSLVQKFKNRLNYGPENRIKECKPCEEKFCSPTSLGW